jgi:D-beta-D-heptose 7-phosphate kinase/D-beta-D-heptose 1-phosphate adenosyltransferase
MFRADREQTDPIHPSAGRAHGAHRCSTPWPRPRSRSCPTTARAYLAGDVPTQLLEAARASGRILIVDPRGVDFSRYAGADIVMPNRPELAAATGHELVDTEAAIVAAGLSPCANGSSSAPSW